jgi:hypothetical protein
LPTNEGPTYSGNWSTNNLKARALKKYLEKFNIESDSGEFNIYLKYSPSI